MGRWWSGQDKAVVEALLHQHAGGPSVCACVCVRVCVRACVCVSVCVCVYWYVAHANPLTMYMCVRVCVCVMM